MYTSIIGVFSPELLECMMMPLSEKGAKINSVQLPSDPKAAFYEVLPDEFMDYVTSVIFLGVSLILPFKQVNEQNYEQFVTRQIKGIAGKMGLPKEKAMQLNYPVSLGHAEMIRGIFCSSRDFKQEIIRFAVRAGKQGEALGQMASYVANILAFSEMTVIAMIFKALVLPKSPVLRSPLIQHEAQTYVKALHLILRCQYPQYFRHFCDAESEQLMQRRNFPILGAVAKTILLRHSNNRSLANYAGTTEEGSEMVVRLVALHDEFCTSVLLTDANKAHGLPV